MNCNCDIPVTDSRRPTHCHYCGLPKRVKSKPCSPEKRAAKLGVFTLIAVGDGYVMVRQAACYPVVWTLKFWESLPIL